jgi:hypothetical protein
MKLNHAKVIPAMLLGSSILVAQRASASRWSATASTCQPDSSASSATVLFTGETDSGAVTFADDYLGIGNAIFRCDVTNPLDGAEPSWIALTVGYQDPDGKGHTYQVTATLYRVDKSTGDFSKYRRL